MHCKTEAGAMDRSPDEAEEWSCGEELRTTGNERCVKGVSLDGKTHCMCTGIDDSEYGKLMDMRT